MECNHFGEMHMHDGFVANSKAQWYMVGVINAIKKHFASVVDLRYCTSLLTNSDGRTRLFYSILIMIFPHLKICSEARFARCYDEMNCSGE